MADSVDIQGYITLVELIIHAGIATEEDIRAMIGSSVSPANLEAIINEATTRLARRGITPPPT